MQDQHRTRLTSRCSPSSFNLESLEGEADASCGIKTCACNPSTSSGIWRSPWATPCPRPLCHKGWILRAPPLLLALHSWTADIINWLHFLESHRP